MNEDLTDISIVGLYEDPMLGGNGVGTADVDASGNLTRIVCGRFGANPVPKVGNSYTITGRRKAADTPARDFRVTMRCQHLPNEYGDATFAP